jgi:hypothetical protein
MLQPVALTVSWRNIAISLNGGLGLRRNLRPTFPQPNPVTSVTANPTSASVL